MLTAATLAEFLAYYIPAVENLLDILATPAALEQGKTLLTSIFGSGDLGNVVSMVAEKAGVDGSIITRMLPVATTVLGAFLSKRVANGENLADSVNSLASIGHEGILGAVKTLAAKIFG